MDFNGTKIALIYGDKTIVLLRDNHDGLEDANKWDLPGGGRESDETPEECAIREVQEELTIKINPASIVWKKEYDSLYRPGTKAWFMIAEISENQVKDIILGDENQKWDLIKISDYLVNPNAVEYCQSRLQDYLYSK